MICPHCNRNLLQRNRTNLTCSYCTRRFAFDPKTNGLGLHDIKVRRLAEKLAEGGRSYTQRQLWYAVSRTKITEPAEPLNGCGCGLFTVVTLLVIFYAVSFQPSGGTMFGVVIGAVILLAGANTVFAVLRPILRGRKEIVSPVSEVRFQGMMADWRRIYGTNPPGMIDTVPPPAVHDPEAALVCPDRTVLDCLTANGVPHRAKLALAINAAGVPPDVPVILLHDASVAGLLFAAANRAALPGRTVIDAGLRPATAQRRRGLLRLRRTRYTADQLYGLDVTREEAQWLMAGWWAPIGAVPPAKLLSTVDRVLARADRSRAVAVGFLTWPE